MLLPQRERCVFILRTRTEDGGEGENEEVGGGG